ncbi:peptidoglycan DD-metalloendopeptidase family protein [Olivibacter sp. SDN3]|uniref:M23 family metallopeptidase n=1 Tax=Olivibacter sp. SDN3 TaxID=2764720 RepID=UPI00165146F1|nr:peptidoglycan DD-metalloendopeptidase family protein [Olivibacter sp. SDN3]QNL48892.1 peptidoglycan DD-metalloendopeptidase family protein [Olivibacter sp. SDN3]
MKFKKKTIKILIALTIVLGSGFVFFSAFELNKPTQKEVRVSLPSKPVLLPKQFGLHVDSFNVHKKTVARNQFLSNILEEHAIDRSAIAKIVEKSKSVFNVRKISAGNPYTIFTYKNDPQRAAYFIYQPNPVDYIVFDLRDSMRVYTGKKDVTKKTETLASSINHSLYDALQKNGGDPLLAMQLAEIYGWAIDFYAINKDDWFKIQYEREYVDGKPIGPGKIQSAIFSHKGKELQAYYFQPDSTTKGGFYDEEGNSVKRAFLKAPLKFSRITSRYTNRRLHPVQKVWKAHLGTDYAAPSGTPIIATGSGTVVESAFTKYNGNYVKIKHNGTYTTQYLHMSRRAVKRGQNIQQGQVIGYVGSTGLATGPHVCYRFWKNGKQVDALKQNFHETIPLSEEFLAQFKSSIIAKQQLLASLKLDDNDDLLAASTQANELEEKTAF